MRQQVGVFLAVLLCVSCVACKGRNVPPKPKRTGPQVMELRKVAVPQRGIIKHELSSFDALPNAYTKSGELPPEPLVNLGRMLFYEERLSKNHDVPCFGCHDLADYGMDGQAFSIGHQGKSGKRNAPTVFNAAGNATQFWDGRSRDVEEQAKHPILDPLEMAMPSEQHILAVLRSIPGYVEAFKAAFPEQSDAITIENLGKAIGAFERGLVTPSRWDDFRRGDPIAITREEKQGFVTFNIVGCPSCHSGTLVGGSLFETLGRARPWPNQEDGGREQVTGKASQRMIFKTASLRNVEKTGPYFHDASSTGLDDAVRRMAEHQLGVELSATQIASIVAFLKTLTGSIDQEYIKEPKLPESGPTTPKPDPS